MREEKNYNEDYKSKSNLVSRVGRRAVDGFKNFWEHRALRNVSILAVSAAGLLVPGGGVDYLAHRIGTESADSAMTTIRNEYLNRLSTQVVNDVRRKADAQLHGFVNNNFSPAINTAINNAANNAVEKLEVEFNIDLNHDGYIGVPPAKSSSSTPHSVPAAHSYANTNFAIGNIDRTTTTSTTLEP